MPIKQYIEAILEMISHNTIWPESNIEREAMKI